MKNAVLLYTHNLLPKKLFQKTLSLVFDQIRMLPDSEVIIVSHYPVLDEHEKVDLPYIENWKFDKVDPVVLKEPVYCKKDCCCNVRNYVIGPKKFSLETIYYQILFGASQTDAEYIFFAEHDVMYPKDYFYKCSKVLSCGFPICYWRSSSMFCEKGFFRIDESCTLSRFSFEKTTLKDIYKEKIEISTTYAEPVLGPINPNNLVGKKDNILKNKIYFDYCIISGEDVLDVKHGLNASGQIIVDQFQMFHPYWGAKDAIKELIDDQYSDVVAKNPVLGYGTLF